MELKEVFETITGLDNGAEMLETIKAELKNVRNEAAGTRTELTKEKNKNAMFLSSLGIDPEKDIDTQIANINTAISKIRETGQKAEELPEAFKSLQQQVETLVKQNAEEKSKRQETLKKNKLLGVLTNKNAIDPESLAKILIDNIVFKEDGETMYFTTGDNEQSIDEGVDAWLKDKTWAVKTEIPSGGGASPADPTITDDDMKKWRDEAGL